MLLVTLMLSQIFGLRAIRQRMKVVKLIASPPHKICDTSICRPLKLIFQSCLESAKFPTEWKKVNVVPVHKKGDKLILKDYRPMLLLPTDGKISEILLYDRMSEFFKENNLISKSQSGFRPGDSFINQLLSITHEIYQPFDDNLEIRPVFLDISKAFDKVWHKGLIFKLKQNGVSDKIFEYYHFFP